MSKTVPLTVRGDVDPRAIEQLRRCAATDDAVAAAICADGHVGYSQPIGGVVAYRDHISPSGVGYDIGCGNKAVRTDLRADEVPIAPVMDEIARRVSFGIGRPNDEPVDHPVLDAIAAAPFEPQRRLLDLAAAQLGTVGAGNHYVDLFRDEDGWLWVGVHFGSRGFGYRTASGFLALAAGRRFDEQAPGGEMDAPPVLLPVASELGQAYIGAMQLAGAYASAGRDVVVDKVLAILGARPTAEVHNHHNFAWRERHFGEDVWVVRKGCTPAFPGQLGFVGATMGEESVILEGVDGDGAAALLRSTVHGAGRVMSRRQAAGRSARRWACTDRACGWTQGRGERRPARGRCPRCGRRTLARRMVQVAAGAVDWLRVTRTLEQRGVELRGGAADEAPEAYKRLDAVLAAHADTIRVVHRLRPIGVAMAGPDVVDPFKD